MALVLSLPLDVSCVGVRGATQQQELSVCCPPRIKPCGHLLPRMLLLLLGELSRVLREGPETGVQIWQRRQCSTVVTWWGHLPQQGCVVTASPVLSHALCITYCILTCYCMLPCDEVTVCLVQPSGLQSYPAVTRHACVLCTPPGAWAGPLSLPSS